jgi:hypothetical protein
MTKENNAERHSDKVHSLDSRQPVYRLSDRLHSGPRRPPDASDLPDTKGIQAFV